jgi:H+/Cl- antiporter ClcA
MINNKIKPLNVIGLSIFLGGLAILIGYGFYEFFKDFEIPFLIKIAIAMLITGTIIIIAVLIKERLEENNN